ncbi:hypothetical protein H0H81_009786 [Sphagnurus paluster]|uniref:Uncharacterized protein n=1 Tax=Sphagnurus paluster TaxID=117069 RepID=A0A9P7FVE7_9AGAR|nr:hypothetical protein H0H81_009786 [Sphagnurus paluster]
MKASAITLFVAAISTVVAHPVKRVGLDDITVLNFALTVKHLENSFYSQGLAKYNEQAFRDAGFPSGFRGRFTQVGEHEAAQVAFLSSALGDKATKPCNYQFPYNDPKSFVTLSQVINTGFGDLDAKSAISSGLGWSSSSAWSASVPATSTSWSVAASFTESCPSTNPTFSFKALPAVSFGSNPKSGQTVSVNFKSMADASTPLYVVFFSGFSQVAVPVEDGKVTIPSNLNGTVYTVISTTDGSANDLNIISSTATLNVQ